MKSTVNGLDNKYSMITKDLSRKQIIIFIGINNIERVMG